jgi:hypothetical protein
VAAKGISAWAIASRDASKKIEKKVKAAISLTPLATSPWQACKAIETAATATKSVRGVAAATVLCDEKLSDAD